LQEEVKGSEISKVSKGTTKRVEEEITLREDQSNNASEEDYM